jgi:TonB-dependent starch-binding outer membrane protein SusC
MRLSYLTSLCLALVAIIAIPSVTNAQQVVVTGRVTDDRGQALDGAQVSVPGTGIGTATTSDGRFRLVVPNATAQTTVEVRFIGYGTRTQRLTRTDGAEELVFALPVDALQLDEVVVTGQSGATTRRQLGNSISTVSARDLQASGSVAVDRALTGKVAGALVQQNSGNPAGGMSVRLRGVSTILGSADPLYIVDGVIVNNDSPNLVYLGGYAQNRLVDLNPNDIERIEIVKGAAAAALYGSRANNGVVQIFTKKGQSGTPRFVLSTRWSGDEVRKRLEVNRHPFDAQGNPVQRYDHQDAIFRRAYGTENHLSMTGGFSTTRYYASGGYLKNQGIVRGSDFERINGRVRLDQEVNDWLQVSVGGTHTVSSGREVPNGGLGDLYGAIDGFLFGPNTYDLNPDPQTGLYPNAGAFANPKEVVERYDFSQSTRRFMGDVNVNMAPLPGLNVVYTLGYDGYTQTATGFVPRGSATPGIYALGWSRRGTAEFRQLSHDLNARYQRVLSSALESTSLVGATYQSDESVNASMTSYDLSPVTVVVPGGANRSIAEYRGRRIIQGVFGQQTFGIRDRLYLTAAGRLDASSVFGEDNRWQAYPKVSGSYLVSEEGFWNGSSLGRIIPDFKIRAAWGKSGGLTSIGPYDRFTNFSPTSYEGLPGLIPSRQQGSDIRPERQTGTEIGLDLGIISNRVAMEITAYWQHTSDLLLTRTVALSTGYATRLENAGAIDNRGIEILLRAVPVNTPALRWNTSLTYSANRNEVSNIDGGVRVLTGAWGLSAAINGQPLGVYYAAGYRRDDQGRILATDGTPFSDAKVQIPARDATPRVIGNPNPKWIGAWSNDLNVGQSLSFRMQVDGVFGNDVWNYDRRIGAYPPYGTLKDYELELRGDVATGTGTALWTNFEHWVEDGTYVKLREVSASYAFRPRGLRVEELRISVIGRNLLSFDSYTGYDPEVNTGGQSTGTRGYVFAEVPIPRSISLGVTATF